MREHPIRPYQPIENYGIIGDLHTAGLVSLDGSVDFLPFNRYDFPTIFCALLDKHKGGYWQIIPKGENIKKKQMYLPETGILLTRFFTEHGIVELTDFMPIKKLEHNCVVIRKVKVVKGSITLMVRCCPRFDYARSEHRLQKKEDGYYFSSLGEDKAQFRVMCSHSCRIHDNDLYGELSLKQGDEASFALEAIPENVAYRNLKSLEHYTQQAFVETNKFWQDWVDSSTYQGRWRESILRSAITLKLMTSFMYGSTVAAATFGLPEGIGGRRNWDYRFTWIRDTAFSMYAFLRLGFRKEASEFLLWLMNRCKDMKSAEDLQLMYAVDGDQDLKEQELDHLEGWRNSRPVRVGNAARRQFQLDIYGELIDTIYLYNMHGGPITYEFWQNVVMFVDYVVENWQQPDHGIWEVRAEKQNFLSSKVMAWVAIDRALLIARNRSFPAPLDEWRKARDEIYHDIFENYFDKEVGAFVQYKGAKVVDASALLMPLVRMISPEEPCFLATFRKIEKELTTDSLVYRYNLNGKASDGLKGEEGTFTMCSFWYIENLSKIGQVSKARLHFEKMLGYANHLGLYSEQIGLQGDLLGNFPQAFTHLAMISAAFQLNRDLEAEGKKTEPKDFV